MLPDCRLNRFSSRTCERGTDTCTVYHEPPSVAEAERRALDLLAPIDPDRLHERACSTGAPAADSAELAGLLPGLLATIDFLAKENPGGYPPHTRALRVEAHKDARRACELLLAERGDGPVAHPLAAHVPRILDAFFGRAWSVLDVLRKLADAADHLLNEHGCDTHGHEEIGAARDAARAMVAALTRVAPVASPAAADVDAARAAAREARERERAAIPHPVRCSCYTCDGSPALRFRMYLCATCGNKRCPRATDHRNACTGSNEPGQPGSDCE